MPNALIILRTQEKNKSVDPMQFLSSAKTIFVSTQLVLVEGFTTVKCVKSARYTTSKFITPLLNRLQKAVRSLTTWIPCVIPSEQLNGGGVGRGGVGWDGAG